MTATPVTQETRDPRVRAARQASAVEHFAEVSDLSRIVEHDIGILRTNLAKYHSGHERNETWETAWARLESAWETVRSELADGATAASQTGIASARSDAASTIAQAGARSATSPVARFIDRVPVDRVLVERVLAFTRSFAHRFALASAAHTRRGSLFLVASARAQVKLWEDARPRLASGWKTARSGLGRFMSATHRSALSGAARARSGWLWLEANGRKQVSILTESWATPSLVDRRMRIVSRSHIGERDRSQGRDGAQANAPARLGNARETLRHQPVHGALVSPAVAVSLASAATTVALHVDEPSATSPTGPFVLKPLPWLVGALAPVISSRTMQLHHGCHYAACIESANRLSRNREELAGKNASEIVHWAREHPRDAELLAAVSEAWNHAFFWQCLTPWKKRPGGELRHAIDRAFGDFTSFAHELASAGAAHVGSGWLWLVANPRNQVKILTTPGAESPEGRGYACLMALDLWEHAYYFDHQNRRREYLDAVIDRRLDWEFAEARYGVVLERGTNARRASRRRPPGDRSRPGKRRCKPAASRT